MWAVISTHLVKVGCDDSTFMLILSSFQRSYCTLPTPLESICSLHWGLLEVLIIWMSTMHLKSACLKQDTENWSTNESSHSGNNPLISHMTESLRLKSCDMMISTPRNNIFYPYKDKRKTCAPVWGGKSQNPTQRSISSSFKGTTESIRQDSS